MYNQHITRGYRINYNTWRASFESLFHCHNETVNVWSHLVGFLFTFGTMLTLWLTDMGEQQVQTLSDFSRQRQAEWDLLYDSMVVVVVDETATRVNYEWA